MRKIFLAGLLAIACGAISADAAESDWTPNATLIAQIETKLAPMMLDGSMIDFRGHTITAPDPLDHYSRYYFGVTNKGEKVVVGILSDLGEKPGIHIVTKNESVPDASGGGCHMIHIWYHVQTQKFDAVCSFSM